MTSYPDHGAKTASYYDAVAHDWDHTYGAARQNAVFAARWRRELELALAPVRGAPNALELGAGTGAYVAIAAPFFGRLIASDLSEGMLDVFRHRLAALGIDNVELRCLDALNLDGIADGSMDVVYSLGLLETLPDLGRHFAECARILRPGGTVIGITSNGDCPWYWLRWRLQGGSRHCRQEELVRAKALRRDLTAAGFAEISAKGWGAVPPGLPDGIVVRILKAVGSIVEMTPARAYLGSLSFSARKQA